MHKLIVCSKGKTMQIPKYGEDWFEYCDVSQFYSKWS